MKFLLTNDDGIDAPGLAALESAVAELGHTLVLAPQRHLSGCSHQTTTDRPLELYELAPGRFALDGTPADCTRIGVLHLADDIDWVLAGVNDGGNLGVDVFMSGTVAAAREAALLGKPAIALSHYRRRGATIDWQRAADWTRQALADLILQPCPPGEFWNVNFPHPDAAEHRPALVHCQVDPHPLPMRFEVDGNRFQFCGDYQSRRRVAGRDVEVCFGGNIAVSRLRIDLSP